MSSRRSRPTASPVRGPGRGALGHPAVPARPLAALDPAPGGAGRCRARGRRDGGGGRRPFGIKLLRAPAARSADRRHGVGRLLRHGAVVDVGGRERDAPPVRHQAAAGRLAASDGHRLRSAGPSRSRSAWSNARKASVCRRSRSRYRHVMPEPQPTSRGSISREDAALRHEPDAGQRGAVPARRASALRAWRAGRETRSGRGPARRREPGMRRVHQLTADRVCRRGRTLWPRPTQFLLRPARRAPRRAAAAAARTAGCRRCGSSRPRPAYRGGTAPGRRRSGRRRGGRAG